ncbi:MAG: replication factor C large subunit [Thermoplasmataceae archaeon]
MHGSFWNDYYRPATLDDTLMANDIRLKIKQWISSWEKEEVTKNAMILWGEAGIGKTTTAFAIAKEFGVTVIEMNASDLRDRQSIKNVAGLASVYMDLFSLDRKGFSKVILMDEADNILDTRSRGGGGDTGGMNELLNVIKNTKNPIILTMNDFYGFRRKSGGTDIINLSLTIEFKLYNRKRDVDYNENVRKLRTNIMKMVEESDLRISQSDVSQILERNFPDIRGIINDVQSIALSSNSEMNENLAESSRDTENSIFEAMKEVFRGRNYEKILDVLKDKDFETSDLILWIDKNLPSEAIDQKDLMNAFDILSNGDIYMGRVMRKQHFRYRTYAEDISAGVFNGIKNVNKKFVKYEFPSMIMRMSRSRSSRGARNIALAKIGKFTHTSSKGARELLWFYSALASISGENRKELMLLLGLDEKQMEIITK